ncbi:MAG: hypothetical protein L3J37_11780 [Rhodobacteraceae bacterium]|nr:hypothetical protein [Paracoccaceae bacterium]
MEAANATPKQFGLKVRRHPDTLIVTARNKMGSGERLVVSVGLANHFMETAILKRNPESLSINRNAAVALAGQMRALGQAPENVPSVGGGKLVSGVDAALVLDFLSAFNNHTGSFLTETDPVRKYIEDRLHVELKEWDIYFPGLQKPTERTLIDKSLGFEVACQRRQAGNRGDRETLYVGDNQRVSSRGIERIGLTGPQTEQAKEAFKNETDPPRKLEKLNYPDRIYRAARERPLLVVHLLAIGTEDDDLSGDKPVVAWSISFPKTQLEEKKVEYVVNTTWFRERYREEEDEDEAGGDDDG